MTVQKSGKCWIVTSGELAAEVVPSQGGKIRRLIARPHRRNLFFEDPRLRFPQTPHGKYLAHDISGCDECFPTVGKSRGAYGQDHGLLWALPWHAGKKENRLITWITRPGKMPVRFMREMSTPGPNRLRLDYTLVNLGSRPLPFLYSSHPILALEPESRIELPGVKTLKVLGHNGVLRSDRRQSWPQAGLTTGKTLRLDTVFIPQKKVAGKWFAPGLGEASVTFPGILRKLVLTWDARALPVLGFWLSLGLVLDPGIKRPEKWVCVALEPCTTAHDVLGAASKPPILHPGRPFTFWIQWELLRIPQ